MNFFRSKPKETPKDAIQKITQSIEVLEKREHLLQTKADHELETAKKLANSNKPAALNALKRKKRYLDEIESISQMRFNLETQKMSIESAQTATEAMTSLMQGANALKAIHQNTNMKKVDETMDEVREQMDLAKELSDAVTQPLGGGIYIDDDELANELDSIQVQQIDLKMSDLDSLSVQEVHESSAELRELESLKVPRVAPKPVLGTQQVKEEEEDELAMLKESMQLV